MAARLESRTPRTPVAAMLWGWGLGCLVDIGLILLFPAFFGHWIELLFFPAGGVVAGFAAYVITWPLPALRRRVAGARLGRRGGRNRISIVLALAVLVAAAFAARAPYRAWKVAPNVMMLCIDGATWNIVTPMMEAGRLPHLRRLEETGASGVLRSTDPSFSPVVWTTMASGRGPEVHGITSFYSTQKQLRTPRMWDLFSASGQRVGVFRWLITWPPTDVNGFLVPGILARDGQCHPPEYGFINELRIDAKSGRAGGLLPKARYGMKFLRAGLRMETCRAVVGDLLRATISRDPKLIHVANRRAEIRLNMDVYQHLLRTYEPEFTSFYDNGTDVLGHHYWKYYEPQYFDDVTAEEVARYGALIEDYYALVDEVVGDLLDHVDEQTTVMVVSDHGQKAEVGSTHDRLFPNTEEVLKVLAMDGDFYGIALGADNFVESIKVDRDERRRSLEDGAQRLSDVRVQESGQSLFDVNVEDDVRMRLSVNTDVRLDDQTVQAGSARVSLDEIVFTKPGYSGTHKPEGILICRGPGTRSGVRIDEASLVDVAPTVLYLMGQPLSRELEGDVIWSAFTEDMAQLKPVLRIDSYDLEMPAPEDLDVDEQTMKTLRSLGYIR